MKYYAFLILLLTLLACPDAAFAANTIEEDQSKAVILAYHRIGEDHLPDQSLSTDQFTAHIEELKKSTYTVRPLDEILRAIKDRTPLPPNTITITIEGAYKSTIENAVPTLIAAQLPFTIFYAADALDNKDPEFTDWQTLKTLAKNENIDIQTLPASYSHITTLDDQALIRTLNKARQRHREEFNTEAKILSYPFGEYSNRLKSLAQKQGYGAAFGLHSGAIYSGADRYALPRFSITDAFGDIEHLRFITRAYPLPVSALEPNDTTLTNDTPFFTGFTLDNDLKKYTNALSCFISGHGKSNIERLGARIEIREHDGLLDQDRIRLNCTMPGPVSEDDEPQWRWLGLLYHRLP